MLFNSLVFPLFFLIVFASYWGLNKVKLKHQNLLLLVASYIFYGWWDWRFLLLIFASTLVDYFAGLKINSAKPEHKKSYLWLSIFFNLGLLATFKYFNFFIDNWIVLMNSMGFSSSISSLQLILPVGISFYTFQTMSYTIDIYRGNLQPTKNFINFATFVSFFPQLVAGPIERAKNLLPQIEVKRFFNYEQTMQGLGLVIWGLFKKVVIADTCAMYANEIFDKSDTMDSLSLILGSIYFAFQIYGDFSGYSDIAIGIAAMLGIKLMRNFNYPYFSRDIAEFWRKWHISLTTWFKDYVYIPLGGSRGSKWMQIRNVLIIFLVSGFWHGANWTFVAWGALNAAYFVPLLVLDLNRKNHKEIEINTPSSFLLNLTKIAATFTLTCIAWVFFRAKDITHAITYLTDLFSFNSFEIRYLGIERNNVEGLFLIILFVAIEWFGRKTEHPLQGKLRMIKYAVVCILIMVLGVFSSPESFIYFQF
jgi:D-alanyl-lipoteichoic acid acyltransferase DltB (MBOAT superfamily)